MRVYFEDLHDLVAHRVGDNKLSKGSGFGVDGGKIETRKLTVFR